MHSIQFTEQTSFDGVVERDFTLGDIPGVLWSPTSAAGRTPLILLGHNGGMHKRAPGLFAHARRLVASCAYRVVALDAPGHGDRERTAEDEQARAALDLAGATDQPIGPIVADCGVSLARRAVPEWRQLIDALLMLPDFDADTAIAWGGGITLGTGIGVPLVATEPRIRAAVFGGGFPVGEQFLAVARRITTPVHFLMPWDEEIVVRESVLKLFDAFASTEKTLHANPGNHGAVPRYEHDYAAAFLVRQLSPTSP